MKRQISSYIFDDELSYQKMIMISGPRQVGKTTFTKTLLKNNEKTYYNWDIPNVRMKYRTDSLFFIKDLEQSSNKIVIFDEIHKRKKWKNILKGFYDGVEKYIRFIITGSARLDLFRKSGDSLIGRYKLFHMFPLSIAEILNKKINSLWLCNSEDWKNPFQTLIEITAGSLSKEVHDTFEHLFKFSGFPEPFLRGSERALLSWKDNYQSLILREDLREISNIKEIETIEHMMMLLPGRIGSPLSINALAEDVESTFPTVKGYLSQLEKLWMIFRLKPWNKKINRAIKKERKCYFHNWVFADKEDNQFENIVAASLLRATTISQELAFGKAELWYIRNFDGSEIDFLITLNEKPALLIETKLNNMVPSKTFYNLGAQLNVPQIQLVRTPHIFKKLTNKSFVMSADRLLGVLP